MSKFGSIFFSPLKWYSSKNYVLLKKAQLLYILIIMASFFTVIIFLHTTFILLHYNAVTIISMLTIILLNMFALFLLCKGRFAIAGNAIVVFICIYIWVIMFFDTSNGIVMQIDTIGYILAVLCGLPLVVNKSAIIVLYYVLNLAALYLFTFYLYTMGFLHSRDAFEFAVDNTFAIIILFAITFLLYIIYKNALILAEQEILRNRDLHRQLEEKSRIELEQAHKLAEQSANMADKAEIITGVLHNIGNLLNNVGISAAMVRQHTQSCPADKLVRAFSLLKENSQDLPRFIQSEKGQGIFPYMGILLDQLIREKQEVMESVTRLIESVEHMGEVIRLQQALGGLKTLIELGSLDIVLQEALLIEENRLSSRQIQVSLPEPGFPEFFFDRYRVLQILLNIIRNAVNSIVKCKGVQGEIVIQVRALGKAAVSIDITDNGTGIEEENIEKIFEYGFTTQEQGHGFGLSYSARSAESMGGRLICRNNADRPGATFSLEIPFTRNKD